jgi:COX assembly protein 2
MHPPLHKSKHPHCVKHIDDLTQCHRENPIAKFWGVCNEQKWALDLCLREQKNLKRLKNKIANLEREERRQRRQGQQGQQEDAVEG